MLAAGKALSILGAVGVVIAGVWFAESATKNPANANVTARGSAGTTLGTVDNDDTSLRPRSTSTRQRDLGKGSVAPARHLSKARRGLARRRVHDPPQRRHTNLGVDRVEATAHDRQLGRPPDPAPRHEL